MLKISDYLNELPDPGSFITTGGKTHTSGLVLFDDDYNEIDVIPLNKFALVISHKVPKHLNRDGDDWVKVLSPDGTVGYVLFRYSCLVTLP